LRFQNKRQGRATNEGESAPDIRNSEVFVFFQQNKDISPSKIPETPNFKSLKDWAKNLGEDCVIEMCLPEMKY